MGWQPVGRPLQDILAVYLQIIEDRKVYTSSTPSEFLPWDLQNFTKRDVEKAVAAFVGLIDAMEQKLPMDSEFTLSSPQTQIDLLYPAAVLNKAYIKEDTFLRSFFSRSFASIYIVLIYRSRGLTPIVVKYCRSAFP